MKSLLFFLMFLVCGAVLAEPAHVTARITPAEPIPHVVDGTLWRIDGTRVFQSDSQRVLRELPPLPEARFRAGIAEFGGELYVIGGSSSPEGEPLTTLLSCPLEGGAGWRRHPDLPGGGVLEPQACAVYNELVIAGGIDASGRPTAEVWGYSPVPREGHTEKGYERRADCPVPVTSASPAVRTGQSHWMIASGGKLLLFHDVTDTWLEFAMLDQPIPGGFWRPGASGREWILDNGTEARSVLFDNSQELLPFWDYVVIVLYFVVVAAIGVFFSRRQKNASDFALGGQRIKWWAAAISIMASGVSAVSFMAIPAMIASTSLVFTASSILILPGIAVAAYVTYPLYRRLNITSTYEYLENRYGVTLRLVGSALAIMGQIFARMSVVILLPALAISPLTGISTGLCVLLIGVVTTLYSSAGGFEAVIWTDVIQGLLILVGFLTVGAVAYCCLPDGMNTLVECGLEADKFRLFMTNWDFSLPVIWITVIGTVIGWTTFASDQVTAQRITCTPLKDVRKLSLLSGLLGFIVAVMAGGIGVILFACYKSDPGLLDPAMQNDQMVPLFILKRVPVGITGVIVATLFAASMSTISTSVNTCAVLFGEDFVKRFRKNLSSRAELRAMQAMSLFSGFFGTGMAYYLIHSETPSIQQLNVELGALFGGGFAGVFALGMFTRKTHELGAIVGILCGAVVPFLLKFYFVGSLHWTVWGIAGVLSCMVFGYLASLVIPWKRKPLTGLTIFDQMPETPDTPGADESATGGQ